MHHAVAHADRLCCLDALRGVAIIVMVFVNAGGAPGLDTGHTAWDSHDARLLHLADYACPIFVFCIGAAMAVAFVPRNTIKGSPGSSPAPGRSRTTATKHAVRRVVLMGVIGLFIKNGTVRGFGESFDLSVLRLPSVLGRLAGAYLIVALVLIWVPPGAPQFPCCPSREPSTSSRGRWTASVPEVTDHGWRHLAIFCVTSVYVVLTFFIPVPGCPTGYLGPGGTDCGAQSPWGDHACGALCNHTTGDDCALRHCTAGFMGWFDKTMLGTRHLTAQGSHGSMCTDKYKCIEFDDNGPFGVLPSAFHVFLGFTVCRALVQSATPPEKIRRMLAWGGVLSAAGILLDVFGVIPISKNMWSLSYCLWTSGVATFLLCLLCVDTMPCITTQTNKN